MIFPKLKLNSCAAHVCQLGSTPLVKWMNVLNFEKLFGHISCDTNFYPNYIGLWARLHEVCDYDSGKVAKTNVLLIMLGIIHK